MMHRWSRASAVTAPEQWDEPILRKLRHRRCCGARQLDIDGAGQRRAADRHAVAGI
jgi:hypothetical protein